MSAEDTLREVATRYLAALPEGQFFHFPVTAIDHTGIPAWSNVFLPGPLSGGDGYGLSDAEAEVGALGELHERLQSFWVVPTLPREASSYHDLVAAYGAAAVTDPVTLGLPAGSRYHHHMQRLWVRVKRYPEGERLLPLEAVASSPAELPAGYEPLFLPVSNGLGAGLEPERGSVHGLLELLQRDGNSVSYRAFDQGRVIDLPDALTPAVAEVLERLRACEVEPNIKLASTEFGLVNLYVNGASARDDPPQIKAAAGGEACDPDRNAALRKALLEFAFARARLAFSHGPLQDAARLSPEGYMEAHRAHFSVPNEEPRALRAMMHWLELSPRALKTTLEPIYHKRESVRWAELPHWPEGVGATPGERLREVVRRLEGFEVLYQELATPRAQAEGVVAVKVVVPGLEVETGSYGRIGARNLGRLLARASPLVGVGVTPPGAARVRLTAEAEARFGGPAWFHVERLAELVGDLYPLYREPSRHAAPRLRT